jgi:hypothetical protein
MNRRICFFLLTSLVALNLTYSQEAVRKSVAVTVYNTNLGVVKDLRSFDITKGTSTISLTDVAEFIDPTSVHIKFNGEALEQNYKYDLVSLDKILQKYIDKNVQLIGEKDELLEGKLLSSRGNQIVLQKKDGGLLMLPSTAKYRISVNSLPDELITRPTLVWLINSPSSGKQDVEVSYQTAGLNWHAEYVAVLNKDDSKMDINSWVSVENNSGATYKDAKLKLVAGDVNIVKPRGDNYGVDYSLLEVSSTKKMAKGFVENPFFEYHIYELQNPTTIAQAETKQISLFEAANIKVNKKYIYKSGNASGQPQKISVMVEFENKEENNLGIPMPKGKVRIYKADGKSLEFAGEDMVDHTPKNEKVKLKIGDAFDVTAEEIQTDNKQITSKVSEQSYKITLKNRKDENIVVDVERNLGQFWEITDASSEYVKKDSQNITFKIPVKKDSEAVITFTVKYSYQ